MPRGDRVQALLAIACLGDLELEPLVRRKRCRDREPIERVVIDDQYANAPLRMNGQGFSPSLPPRSTCSRQAINP